MTPSAHKKRTGDRGEDLAARYLEGKGYEILDRNFKTREGEIDIIARDGDTLVFVEVKTGAGPAFGDPGEWVDDTKQRRICATSEDYLYRHEIEDMNCRYDVIAVRLRERGHSLKHIPGAFWAEF